MRLPPDPLLPEGHDFTEDEVLVTSWGGILPSVDFSRKQFEELIRTAVMPQINQPEEVVLFAQYLASREGFVFDEETGCWHLPLKASYDKAGRARYPSITLGALNLKNKMAHRASLSILRGETVDDLSVDHLCRHAFLLQPIPSGSSRWRH